MKLATWNVQRLTRATSVRMSRVRPYLDAINADIWVLTETGEDVSPGPGYQGVATTEFDRASHDPGEVWTKIWSRWPIERLAPVSDPARCVAARVVPPHRAPLIVYGTVLPWPSSTWRGLAYKGGLAFGAALEAQASDWASLQAAYPSDDLFAMGDLNQDLCVGKPAYCGSRLNQGRLREALARASLVAFTDGVDDPIRRDSPPMACIDHICGPARLSASVRSTTRWPEAPAPVRGLSDHFGVAVELGL
jgi:endonuclease/exonuclease/phosphatase family metal-dependent hydrolase